MLTIKENSNESQQSQEQDMQQLSKFKEFTNLFEQKANKFIPLNKSNNELRHFGTTEKCILENIDVLYLFYLENNKNLNLNEIEEIANFLDLDILKVKIYFYIKENQYNLFLIDGKNEYLIFDHTKHFNRNKCEALGILSFTHKNDSIQSKIENNEIMSNNNELFNDKLLVFSVCSENIFTLLSFRKTNMFNKECKKSLIK